MVTLLRYLKMKNLNKLNPRNMVLLEEPSIMGGQNNDKHDNRDENAGNANCSGRPIRRLLALMNWTGKNSSSFGARAEIPDHIFHRKPWRRTIRREFILFVKDLQRLSRKMMN